VPPDEKQEDGEGLDERKGGYVEKVGLSERVLESDAVLQREI
jgi:hypothetical protein